MNRSSFVRALLPISAAITIILTSTDALRCYECHECTPNTTKKVVSVCQSPNDRSCMKRSKTIGNDLISLELGCSSNILGADGFIQNTNCNGYQWGTMQHKLECFIDVYCTGDLCNNAAILSVSKIIMFAAPVVLYLGRCLFHP